MSALRKPQDRSDDKPIGFNQLCAVARELLLRDPTMDFAEWAEQIKCRVSALRFADPEDPDELRRAMRQIDHSVTLTLGPRPVPKNVSSVPVPPQQADPPWARGFKPLGWLKVEELLRARRAVTRPAAPTPEPLPISEPEALARFYAAVNVPGADRLAVLRVFAEVAILRPADWDPAAIRAAAGEHTLFAERCFGCLAGGGLSWHHVIQIQFGGSNTPRNRTALCDACHATVHPWLADAPPRGKGWTSVGGMARRVLDGRR